MNKADEELIQILKDTFLVKKNRTYEPDEHLRCLILKLFLGASLLGSVAVLTIKVSGKEVPTGLGELVSIQLALFFGFLFIRINSKSSNFSIIVFGLTWLSMVLGFYFGNL